LRSPDESMSPFKKVQPKLCQKMYVNNNDPFEVAKDVSPEKGTIPKYVEEEDFQMSTPESKKISTSNKATHLATTQISNQTN